MSAKQPPTGGGGQEPRASPAPSATNAAAPAGAGGAPSTAPQPPQNAAAELNEVRSEFMEPVEDDHSTADSASSKTTTSSAATPSSDGMATATPPSSERLSEGGSSGSEPLPSSGSDGVPSLGSDGMTSSGSDVTPSSATDRSTEGTRSSAASGEGSTSMGEGEECEEGAEEFEFEEVTDDLPMELHPGLFIGSMMAEMNRDGLKDAKISHVLQVGDGLEPTHKRHFTYKTLSLCDVPGEDLVIHFPDCFSFIETALAAGGRVMVHCVAGVSRSATVCIGYLMWKARVPYASARQHVAAIRPWIAPNIGFHEQLIEFERMECDFSRWTPWNADGRYPKPRRPPGPPGAPGQPGAPPGAPGEPPGAPGPAN